MATITIVPHVGKGATVVWETVPNVSDEVHWEFESQHGNGTQHKSGVVQHREFDVQGNVTLYVQRGAPGGG